MVEYLLFVIDFLFQIIATIQILSQHASFSNICASLVNVVCAKKKVVVFQVLLILNGVYLAQGCILHTRLVLVAVKLQGLISMENTRKEGRREYIVLFSVSYCDLEVISTTATCNSLSLYVFCLHHCWNKFCNLLCFHFQHSNRLLTPLCPSCRNAHTAPSVVTI